MQHSFVDVRSGRSMSRRSARGAGPWTWRKALRILMVAAVLWSAGAAGRAEAEQAAPAAAVTTDASEGGALDTFNDYMHSFNLGVWDLVDRYGGSLDGWALPESVRIGLSNMLLNLFNEPTTMISWLVAGDYHNAGISAERFWINLTRGWFGTVDVATGEGIVAQHIDIGLALCARGVGEGGYIVLPFIGPRTVRDGLSDFLLVNTLTYLALSPVIGFPPSPETFLLVEVGEEAAAVGIVRQIDHADDRNRSLEAVREEYLQSRRDRCEEVKKILRTRSPAE